MQYFVESEAAARETGGAVTIRSMTGFGRARGAVGDEWAAEVVAASVNHRFLDLDVKVRENEASSSRSFAASSPGTSRAGKVEVSLRLKRAMPAPTVIAIDEGLLESAARPVRGALGAVPGERPAGGARPAHDPPDLLGRDLRRRLLSGGRRRPGESSPDEAARALVAMREAEGASIAADLSERVRFLEKRLEGLALRRDEILGKALENLRERLRAPDAGAGARPRPPGAGGGARRRPVRRGGGAPEAGGAPGPVRELLATSDEPVGKKLDFLAQEILRELNTLGLQGPRPADDPRGARHEVRDREDPGAGPEPGMRARARGNLFIVSSPSGGGKTTLIRRLIADPPGAPLHFSVSHTTRPKRAGERNGREYHFVTDEAFRKMAARRAFLEHNVVHGRRLRHVPGRGPSASRAGRGRRPRHRRPGSPRHPQGLPEGGLHLHRPADSRGAREAASPDGGSTARRRSAAGSGGPAWRSGKPNVFSTLS